MFNNPLCGLVKFFIKFVYDIHCILNGIVGIDIYECTFLLALLQCVYGFAEFALQGIGSVILVILEYVYE